MDNAEKESPRAKTYLTLVALAVVTAVAVTLIQTFLLGGANIAITGGIVGGVTGAFAFSKIKKRAS